MMEIAAKDFVYDDDSLTFQFYKRNRYIVITLNERDYYTIELWKIKKGNYATPVLIATADDVAADQLDDVILKFADMK